MAVGRTGCVRLCLYCSHRLPLQHYRHKRLDRTKGNLGRRNIVKYFVWSDIIFKSIQKRWWESRWGAGKIKHHQHIISTYWMCAQQSRCKEGVFNRQGHIEYPQDNGGWLSVTDIANQKSDPGQKKKSHLHNQWQKAVAHPPLPS